MLGSETPLVTVSAATTTAPRPPRAAAGGRVPARPAGRSVPLGPARPPAPPPGGLPPHSLAAGLLATGARDAALGLERVPRRRAPRRGRARWLWGGLLAGALALAALGWQGGTASTPPSGSAPVAAHSQAAASPPPASALRVSVRPVETNYTVMPGDTLERIAQRFGTTVEAIAGMNNLRDYNHLRVGQKLIIP